MKSAHSEIPVNEAPGIRAPYAVRSPLWAGPKWKFESITFFVRLVVSLTFLSVGAAH